MMYRGEIGISQWLTQLNPDTTIHDNISVYDKEMNVNVMITSRDTYWHTT